MADRNMSKDRISKAKVSGHDMREYDMPRAEMLEAARKRRGHLRKINMGMLRITVAILLLLCGALMIRIRNLNRTIERLSAQTGRLTQMVAQQRDLLEELAQGGDFREEPGEGEIGDIQGTVEVGGQDIEEAGTADEARAAHQVYLTFDDGPSANTQKILDILDRYDVKATFFVVGKKGSESEDMLKKIVEAGHTLGMHSYTHDYSKVYGSLEGFGADLAKQQAQIYDITGVWSKVYRFPGGSSNTVSDIDMKEFARYLDVQEIRFYDWNISSGDGGSFLVPVETLIENCTSKISKNSTSIILMHDSAGKSTTLEALPEIIEKIQAMEDTVLLPITDDTVPVQHIDWRDSADRDS